MGKLSDRSLWIDSSTGCAALRPCAAGTDPGIERDSRPLHRQRSRLRRARRTDSERLRPPGARPCRCMASAVTEWPNYTKLFRIILVRRLRMQLVRPGPEHLASYVAV